jgi:hypothetical protein
MTPGISGLWHGVLDTGTVRAKLAISLAPTDGLATLHLTVAGDVAVPLSLERERVIFGAADYDIAFDLAPDGERLTGSCRHAHALYPFALQRGRTPPKQQRPPRPQTPRPPFPYDAETVSFRGADGTRRAGALTRPAGPPPWPAVILCGCMGPFDRDETQSGHKAMALWADILTRAGLATLRYDKRGVGASEGDFSALTLGDLADDLTCALAFLRDQRGVDAARVGLVGHSEGSHVSAEAAARDPSVGCCVMLTPAGVDGEVTFESEMFRAAIAVGGTPIAGAEALIALNRALRDAGRAPTAEEAVRLSREVLAKAAAAGDFPAAQIERRAAMSASPWQRYWWTYDPTRPLRRLACPVLVVFGGLDLQAPPSWHAPPIRAALAAHPGLTTVVELPGLNHFLQTARTGAISEYADLEETLAPAAITTVRDWLLAMLSATPARPPRGAR